MVTAVLDNSERIRVETDEVVRAMNEFVEYKFHSTYNSRVLFYLTQGQVRMWRARASASFKIMIMTAQRVD